MMKIYNSEIIENQFLHFESPRGFRRIDADHSADWYLGLDEDGNNALRLLGSYTPQQVADTSAISIKHFVNGEIITFQISLNNNEFKEVFINLCTDLINLTVSKNSFEAYQMSLIRIESWKSMFQSAPKEILPFSELMGLIGELLFLQKYFFKNYSIEDSIKSWSGSEKTKKDFSINNEWFEVKTTSSSKGRIRITSLEQLESTENDNGNLAILQLERMSGSYGGLTLNELVNQIANEIGSSPAFRFFQSKLDSSGYQFHEDYDIYRFSINSFRKFVVNDEFPKLLKRYVPNAVVSATYEIDINALSEFFIGEII